MAFPKRKLSSVKGMILDPSVPFEHRKQILAQLVMHDSEESNEVLASILEDAVSRGDGTLSKELNDIMKEMSDGPIRFGTFIGYQTDGPVRRAKVRLEDGTTVFPFVSNADLANKCERGANVLLDSQGMAVIGGIPFDDGAGEEAKFERRIGPDCVEISLRGDERYVFDASQTLIDALERGEVTPGSRLLVCSRRLLAFRALPTSDGPSHYRYLLRGKVPDVVVERDIGAPPSYIDQVTRMVHTEMTNPEIRRRYHLRRCTMKLLAGISGSGKSYSLLGLWRRIYEVMSEVTGVLIDDLPPRLLRLRPSQVLSKWFGETDQNLDRFFTEVERLADEKFVAPNGKEYTLPVLAVLEEIDGLTRNRGEDPLHDRIMTTILELLDPTRPEIKDKLIIFIGTTNVARQIDMAFLRRIGGTVEKFGRLNRNAFVSVLEKHIVGIPFASTGSRSRKDSVDGAVTELTSWLFSPNGEDRGQVELLFAGSNHPDIAYRRDFLTAGLVDRAVQEAASIACDLEINGTDSPGLTVNCLKSAFDHQIRAVVDQLCPENAASYLELPEGRRVQRLIAMEQPTPHPFELLRVS